VATRAEILIVIDAAGERVPPVGLELMGAALQLARQCAGGVSALLRAAPGDAAARELIAHGADCVYVARNGERADQTVEARLPLLLDLCRRVAPRLVLLAHDVIGAELAPRLAFRLDGAVTTGCVDIVIDDGAVRCTRPCYGGVAREIDRFDATPLVATVRAGVFEPAPLQPDRDGEIVILEPQEAIAPRTRLIAREIESADGVRLDDARTIVAGGRGLQGPEGFKVLDALARELGGAVGASRVPCDLGWCPHSWQIGLTGKTVTPELYIAVGISGAGHHMAGCGNAKTIVAINTDAEAAIFQDARFGVLGDYREVVPALAAELQRLKQAR
jgi:electron transfer flavoprotein alpha subunit